MAKYRFTVRDQHGEVYSVTEFTRDRITSHDYTMMREVLKWVAQEQGSAHGFLSEYIDRQEILTQPRFCISVYDQTVMYAESVSKAYNWDYADITYTRLKWRENS